MIKFGGTSKDGKQLIGLALGRANIERLMDGQPIFIDAEDVGAPGIQVLLIYAETSAEAMEEFRTSAEQSGTPIKGLEEAVIKSLGRRSS